MLREQKAMKQITVNLIQVIESARDLYYRLVLLVGHAGSGKTRTLQEASKDLGAPLINVNLELSRRLLDMTQQQRALQTSEIMREIVGEMDNDIVLLDNIEILFSKELNQNTLPLLQGLSRNRVIVASWNGKIVDGKLIYAEPDHHEFQRHLVRDFLMVELDG